MCEQLERCLLSSDVLLLDGENSRRDEKRQNSASLCNLSSKCFLKGGCRVSNRLWERGEMEQLPIVEKGYMLPELKTSLARSPEGGVYLPNSL